MPLSDTLLVAIAGFASTLLATVIGWVANVWSQRRHRQWQLEDDRRRRREEYLNQELSVIREYVDDLTTVLRDEWDQWLAIDEAIEDGRKFAAYEEGLRKRRVEFEEKWFGLQGSVWPHLRAVNDAELRSLVGKLRSLYWGQLTYALRKDQSEAREELFGTITRVYKRLEELALD